jgi:exopolyphosphatase / guanosine-5'-triphosphate,3'-diphosphate pyrophosphatase
MRFAAIDIGSNALRLLTMNVFANNGNPIFKKESLIRIPLRLGEEAFMDGKISDAKINKLSGVMQAFKNLMEANDVLQYRACATAAMREASNGPEIIEKIFAETRVQIEIVDGSREAQLIYSNQIVETMEGDKYYLYIDVGGGSTEISLISDGKIFFSQSFPIGTLKILNNQVEDADWAPLMKVLKDFRKEYKSIIGIGSGGNINKIFKLYGDTEKGTLSQKQLVEAWTHLNGYSYAERVTVLGLKPDRADVILPATEIFLFISRHAGIKNFLVPKIGLSDGIIHQLFAEYQAAVK